MFQNNTSFQIKNEHIKNNVVFQSKMDLPILLTSV